MNKNSTETSTEANKDDEKLFRRTVRTMLETPPKPRVCDTDSSKRTKKEADQKTGPS